MEKVRLLKALRLLYLWTSIVLLVAIVVLLIRGNESTAHKVLLPGVFVLAALYVLEEVLEYRRRRIR